jgi:hypothetical protein
LEHYVDAMAALDAPPLQASYTFPAIDRERGSVGA